MNIPIEILNEYRITTLENYKNIYDDSKDTELLFYKSFLIATDHIPNKIIESLIENLASATLTTFIGVFLDFIKQVRVDYKDVLQCRKTAREEINRIEAELAEVASKQ